jgi:hypothetical protein
MASAKVKRNIRAKTLYAPKYVWERFDAIKNYYIELFGFENLTNSDILRCMAKRIEINTDKVIDLMDSKYIFHLKSTTSSRIFSLGAYKKFLYSFKQLTDVFDKNFTFEIIVNLYWMEVVKK